MSDLVQRLRDCSGPNFNTVCAEAADELERLTRELEEARKDAERYRWLRNKALGTDWTEIGNNTTPDTTDAAIDAAMSQEK